MVQFQALNNLWVSIRYLTDGEYSVSIDPFQINFEDHPNESFHGASTFFKQEGVIRISKKKDVYHASINGLFLDLNEKSSKILTEYCQQQNLTIEKHR